MHGSTAWSTSRVREIHVWSPGEAAGNVTDGVDEFCKCHSIPNIV